MLEARKHIIEKLKKDILPLQGYKPVQGTIAGNVHLGPVMHSFPGNRFPVGSVHECIIDSEESAAATSGFIAAISGKLMNSKGVGLWIGDSKKIYPPALVEYNILPQNVIFLDLKKEKEILWAAEEALRCEALTCVVAEVQGLGFTESRRLQLAVEQSRVTGFIFRKKFPRQLSTSACICRWRITPQASSVPDGMPGVGFQNWNVELMKVRNGLPGQWIISWVNGEFVHDYPSYSIVPLEKLKTG